MSVPKAYIEERGGTSRVRVRYDSGHRRDIATFDNPEHAEQVKTLAQADLIVGKDPKDRYRNLLKIRPDVPKMGDLLDRLARRQDSVSGVKTYRATAARCGEIDIRADDIAPQQIQEWIDELAEELSLNTVSRYVGNCARAWSSAMLPGENPFKNGSLRVWSQDGKAKRPNIPNHEQFQAIVSELDDFYSPVAALQELTGLRRMEIQHLRCSDVDLNEGVLSVRKTKGNSGGIRSIPLCSEAIALCEDIISSARRGSEELVFPGYHPHTYNKALVAACGRIQGVPHTTSHRIRHRAISLWIKAKVDIITVAQVAGHERPSMTTDVYGHALPNEPKDRIEMIGHPFL